MVQEAVEEGGDGRGIAEQLPPVVDRPIRGEERARAFVPAHHELEDIFGGRGRELPHAEVVDDEQRHGGEIGQEDPARPVERGVGDLFDAGVRLAVDDAIALLNGRVANS